jgi:acyl dehydratase
MPPTYDSVEKGTELPAQSFPVRRESLVRYAGASGDSRVATSVGLPDVIAHGMFTMASAVRVVTDWVGDPGAVEEYGVRFTRPVVVPDDADGATIEVSGTVAEKLDDGRVKVNLRATSGGDTVLGKAVAVVRLP